MVSPLFFYQLVLIALVWLFIMLHLAWPSRTATTPPRSVEPEPIRPQRKRSTASKPFPGLTQKPYCARCEQETASPQRPPLIPPDPMPTTNRRPRTVDTSRHFCPHEGCAYRGWLGRGNLRANGHPSGGPWRQFH